MALPSSPNEPSREEPCRDGKPTEFCPALPEEGINNPPYRPIRSLFVNLLKVAAVLLAVFLCLDLAANHLARFVPFSWERWATGDVLLEKKLDARGRAKEQELRRIASRLSAAADFPAGMDVRIFYNPGKTQNAYATFGGNIIVFDGLLDLVESEDGVAMVLAHEMMHIKHRDAVRGVVRGVGLMLLASGIQGGRELDGVLRLGEQGYSRGQEEEADLGAVAVLGKVYGHAGGAEEFFRVLAEKVEKRRVDEGAHEGSALGSSHPDTLVRLRRVREEAKRLGLPEKGEMTPLSDVLDQGSVWIETGPVKDS